MRRASVFLVVTLLTGLGLRLWGSRWGLPYAFAFDESLVVDNAARFGILHTLEPRFLAYPTLFLYELFGLYASYFALGSLMGLFRNVTDFAFTFATDPSVFYLLGRWATAAAGTATIGVVYLLGKRAFSLPVGLVAAAFLAFFPSHVGESQWALPDVTATLLATVAYLFCYLIYAHGQRRYYAAAGFTAGLATSTMYNGAFMVFPLYLAHFLRWRETEDSPGKMRRPWRSLIGNRSLLLAGLFLLGGFFLGSPYWLLRLPAFLAAYLGEASEVMVGVTVGHATGEGELPWLWVLRQHWDINQTMGAVFLLGVFYALWRHKGQDWLLALPTLALILFIGAWSMRNLEYLLPIWPIMAVLGARMVVELLTPLARGRSWVWAAAAVVLLSLPLASIVRSNLALGQRDTRVVAKEWIETNIPKETALAFDWYHYSPPLVGTGENYIRYPGTQISLQSQAYGAQAGLRERLEGFLSTQTTYQLRSLYPKTPDELHQEGVEYIILSSYYYSRYFETPPRVDSPARPIFEREGVYFKELLDPGNRGLALVAEFRPDSATSGPTIKVLKVLRETK